jgi:hypothetical protein
MLMKLCKSISTVIADKCIWRHSWLSFFLEFICTEVCTLLCGMCSLHLSFMSSFHIRAPVAGLRYSTTGDRS